MGGLIVVALGLVGPAWVQRDGVTPELIGELERRERTGNAMVLTPVSRAQRLDGRAIALGELYELRSPHVVSIARPAICA
jgi:hypothetical protein